MTQDYNKPGFLQRIAQAVIGQPPGPQGGTPLPSVQPGGVQSGGVQSGGVQSGGLQSGGVQSGGVQTGSTQTLPPPSDTYGVKPTSSLSGSDRAGSPSRLPGNLGADTPVALTTRTVATGLKPPKNPRIFVGAEVSGEGGVKGKLVGYSSSGTFLVKTNDGKVERVNRLSVTPSQQFVSVAETLPKANVVPATGASRAALDSLLAQGVGNGSKQVLDVIGAIRDSGFEVFIAGGAVRDALQGVAPRDVDLATTMWIQEADRAMSRANLPTGMTRSEFGTMLVGRGGANELDVCSLKAGKGSFGFSLPKDVESRDFTFNSLYYDPANGVILDPTGTGVDDAKNKFIRPACQPGQEKQWLQNNPSGVLRFLKFTLRGYSYDPALLQLVKDNFASSVRSMDGLRRDRQLDSVVPKGDRKAVITAEMKRLGFPQSDIDALFGSSFRSSWSNDNDDVPAWRRRDSVGPGGSAPSTIYTPGATTTGSATHNAGPTQPSSTAPTTTGVPTPPPVGYIGPSATAVDQFARARGFHAIDLSLGPTHHHVQSVKVGRLPPSWNDAWGQLHKAGFRRVSADRFTHTDGSWVEFTQGQVFRGVGKTVFKGRVPGAGDGGGSGSPAPTPTTQSALAQSPMASGGGVPRTVTTPVSSSSRAMDKLLAAEPMLKPTRPGFNASSLAVAAGHLPRLAPVELAETETLKRKGFAQAKPGLWVHSDKSWVRFHDGNVYRGHEDCVFMSIVNGPGPSAARVAQ